MLFFDSPSVLLNFSRIELQMLLQGCLIHMTFILLKHIIYVVYSCPYLGLGLFMPHLFDLFFISSLIFTVINHITSFKQMYLFLIHFLEYLLLFLNDNVDEESEQYSNSKSSTSGCCLAFALFFAKISLTLLIKVLLIKQLCIILVQRCSSNVAQS